MQALVLGNQIKGDLIYIPNKALSESVIGQTYEAHIRTESLLGLGGASKENIANILMQELPKRVPGLKLKWIKIEDTMIKLQFIGSPFAWSLFIAALPQILNLVGITITVIGVYLIWSKTPSYVIGLLALGLILIYFAPGISKTVIKLLPREIREMR